MEPEWTLDEAPVPQELVPQELPQLGPDTLAAVRELQAGEVQESTRHIFEIFEPQLAGFFRRHGCQDFEADDLTQTVFLRMLDQVGTLKDETSFHFWLFKIARNELRSFQREQGRGREGAEDLANKARGDSEPFTFWVRGTFEPNPEAKLAMSESVERRRLTLRKLLQVTKLAPRTRQSLLLRLHGESYEDIARALEIPVGTVGSHISRASASLLRILDRTDLADVTLEDSTEDRITLEDGDDDLVAELSSELLTFKQEALEADPAYFKAGALEAASADYEVAEEIDEEPLVLPAEKENEAEMETPERVVDSPAAIAAVVREDQARGRSRRRVTRTIPPAGGQAPVGGQAKGPDLGPLCRDDLGYALILLEEAVTLGENGFGKSGVSDDDDLALKAKLTCAGSILARGRRFKTARQVEEIVRHAIILIDNRRRDEVRHDVAEGRTLLRSYLSGSERLRTVTTHVRPPLDPEGAPHRKEKENHGCEIVKVHTGSAAIRTGRPGGSREQGAAPGRAAE